MAPPVKPSDFARAVVGPEDNLAQAILKTYVILPYYLYKLVRWMFNADGSISFEFAQLICSVPCGDTEAPTEEG